MTAHTLSGKWPCLFGDTSRYSLNRSWTTSVAIRTNATSFLLGTRMPRIDVERWCEHGGGENERPKQSTNHSRKEMNLSSDCKFLLTTDLTPGGEVGREVMLSNTQPWALWWRHFFARMHAHYGSIVAPDRSNDVMFNVARRPASLRKSPTLLDRHCLLLKLLALPAEVLSQHKLYLQPCRTLYFFESRQYCLSLSCLPSWRRRDQEPFARRQCAQEAGRM